MNRLQLGIVAAFTMVAVSCQKELGPMVPVNTQPQDTTIIVSPPKPPQKLDTLEFTVRTFGTHEQNGAIPPNFSLEPHQKDSKTVPQPDWPKLAFNGTGNYTLTMVPEQNYTPTSMTATNASYLNKYDQAYDTALNEGNPALPHVHAYITNQDSAGVYQPVVTKVFNRVTNQMDTLSYEVVKFTAHDNISFDVSKALIDPANPANAANPAITHTPVSFKNGSFVSINTALAQGNLIYTFK
jgi:hypothetical protein